MKKFFLLATFIFLFGAVNLVTAQEIGEREWPLQDEAIDCPPSGSVSQFGWSMNYNTTGTDGLRISDVYYNGRQVLTSASLPEWHADYGDSGYQDSTGCGGAGGGFPIYPYGSTKNFPLVKDEQIIGFELVQDFRMNNWGMNCNYRYEQHYQFYQDGSFRVAVYSYGRGCGPSAFYRTVIRLDFAVDGDANDSYAYFDSQNFVNLSQEEFFTPYFYAGHGPYQYSEKGYVGKVFDATGQGYYIQPGLAQFGDGGRGDEPFMFVTQHHANEGDNDLPAFSPPSYCCFNDHRQGPDLFLNNESVTDTNLVVWYVPQAMTDAVNGSNGWYCWTLAGEPNPVTYPCVMGAMFVPITWDE